MDRPIAFRIHVSWATPIRQNKKCIANYLRTRESTIESAIKPYSSLHKYTVSYLESCYRVSIFVDTQTGYQLDSVLRRARESMTRLQC